ncbi:MAG: hypothetical protein WC121_05690 [Candidatus Kapaibacterium sp.]
MRSIASKIISIALLSLLLSLSSCKDDNSTDPNDDNKTSTALAANNTLVSPENTYSLTDIGLFHQNFINELWLIVKSDDNNNNGFTLKVKHPLPTDNSGEMNYITSILEMKEKEFSISELNSNKDTAPNRWYTAGGLTVATKGKLYYKKNDNNTMTFWTNNLELSDDNVTPTKTRKFNFKFTYSLDLDPVGKPNGVQGKLTNE